MINTEARQDRLAARVDITMARQARLAAKVDITMARQGLKRYPCAAAADVFCWRAEADSGSPRTAYKNTAGASRV